MFTYANVCGLHGYIHEIGTFSPNVFKRSISVSKDVLTALAGKLKATDLFLPRNAFCLCIIRSPQNPFMHTSCTYQGAISKDTNNKLKATSLMKISFKLGTYETEAFIIFLRADQTLMCQSFHSMIQKFNAEVC
jgi:hypothetical protein